ncbi:hypothetical protein AURANDRAFT_63262 [Aureococcus anophagefferens]|uniref:Glycosyltransferase n=1 Tax=Aureococcus anophagefferens TaxID=44056 RepID=F0Y613_AURAN|nr:hypothetical protein AURANDRAFT_63262 [Aureococcus anophagefferens]EGB09585.1 hypothetical protein AURANDRAFT_63262 [Aureococcus anophagefferens]|eukprot:XP_009035639.1 hypothetical protein AURANDRAFT_63262 [Aureococcus anophagefferens]
MRWLCACCAVAAAQNVSGVAILTPVHRTHESRHDRYVRNLRSLGGLVLKTCRVAFLVDKTSMPIVKASKRAILAAGFGSVLVVPETGRNVDGEIAKHDDRHDPAVQRQRRSRLARARNKLAFTALGVPFLGVTIAWTLWLDSDLASFPPLIVPRLLEADADVVAPRVVDANRVLYDKNSWQHSEESREACRALPRGALLVQGGYRRPVSTVLDGDGRAQRDLGIAHMDALAARAERFAPLDAVGTACLLIRADVFGDVEFPAELTEGHLLESEGFGELAAKRGYRVVGDVRTVVVHA